MQDLIDKSHSRFRVWFRKVWEVRGGGLYACGFALTFLYFEIGSLREDFAQLGGLLDGQFISVFIAFVIDFLIDSFMNTIKAFAWPVYVVQVAPPMGAIALGLAFAFFPKYVKPHLTRWLFPDGETQQDEKPQESSAKYPGSNRGFSPTQKKNLGSTPVFVIRPSRAPGCGLARRCRVRT